MKPSDHPDMASSETLEEALAAACRQRDRLQRRLAVEEALDRVRARTMAMQESTELREVIATVYEQLQHLGFDSWGCNLAAKDEAGDGLTFWMANAVQTLAPEIYHVPRLDHPVADRVWTTWEGESGYQVIELKGAVKRDYTRLLLEETDLRRLPDPVKAAMQAQERVVLSQAFARHSILEAAGEEALPDDKAEILQRFAQVFEQTYTRFLDLKKAEGQAREAQIEAALERVRSRAMAMHRSDELREVVSKVFEEFQRLEVDAPACSIGIFDEATRASEWWVSSASDTLMPRSYHIPYLEDWPQDWYQTVYHNWQQGVPFFTCSFEGEDKRAFDHKLLSETEFGLTSDAHVEDLGPLEHLILSYAPLKHGVLEVGTTESLPDNQIPVLQRFAQVIDLAYTRFDDLQQAEARAREAVKAASLDRVRAEIASMRTADDLRRITPLIWRELTTLGVPFFRCGVFIIDETTEITHTYLSKPDGTALAALHLSFDSTPLVQGVLDCWRSRQVYTDQWDREQYAAWVRSMVEQGHIDTVEAYPTGTEPVESLALHFVPFTQGMLYVGSAAPLAEDQIDLAQALADAFAVAYARYEDFKQLEAAKAEVEATLADLKATQAQLIHSEKMASLGQMTAGIAHEIKNPLNFVNNFSEIVVELSDELQDLLTPHLDASLQGEADDFRMILGDLKQNASVIAKHGRRADDIVRSMMQHAREGTGTREPTALNALVEEYVNLAYHGMRASTPGFAVEVERSYDDRVGEAPVMGQELGRVLLNLLSNAFYAVHERADAETRGDGDAETGYTPTVRVATRVLDEGVEIRIGDNGPGIPAEMQAKIFEPFFTTKPTGSGTGLGLSLSYDIVTQGHGGTLKVESEEGGGATFVVTLPTTHQGHDPSA